MRSGGTDVPVVAVKLLVGRSRDGRQLVGVTLSVELELVVVPLAGSSNAELMVCQHQQ